MSVPSDKACDPVIQLSMGDTAVDDLCKPFNATIKIKQSKTDLFIEGSTYLWEELAWIWAWWQHWLAT